MSKLKCECGQTLSNSIFPNTLEGEIKGIFEKKCRDVWECRQCGRLHIDVYENGELDIKTYYPEDAKPADLFRIGSEEETLNYLKDLWRVWKKEFLLIEIGEI